MVSFQYFKKIYSKSSNPVGVFGVGLAVFKTSFVRGLCIILLSSTATATANGGCLLPSIFLL